MSAPDRKHEIREARNGLLGILGFIGLIAVISVNELSFPARDQLLPVTVIGLLALSALIWLAFTVWALRAG